MGVSGVDRGGVRRVTRYVFVVVVEGVFQTTACVMSYCRTEVM